MKRVICGLLVLPLLAACSDIRQTVGLGRNNPDEFTVVKNPPLSMPPDFDLRPPDPSKRGPQGAEPAATVAARSVVPTATTDIQVEEATSPGVAALLSQAGAAEAPKNIRATLDAETNGIVVKDRDFVDKLMVWKSTPKADPAVDAKAETKRIEENKSPEGFISGDGAKYETQKQKAPLEGLFN